MRMCVLAQYYTLSRIKFASWKVHQTTGFHLQVIHILPELPMCTTYLRLCYPTPSTSPSGQPLLMINNDQTPHLVLALLSRHGRACLAVHSSQCWLAWVYVWWTRLRFQRWDNISRFESRNSSDRSLLEILILEFSSTSNSVDCCWSKFICLSWSIHCWRLLAPIHWSLKQDGVIL